MPNCRFFFSSQNKRTSLSFPVSFVSCFLIKKLSKMALHLPSLERIFVLLLCCVYVLLLVEVIFFLWVEAPSSPPASAPPTCYFIIAFVHTSPTRCLLACLLPTYFACLLPTCYMLPICLLLIVCFCFLCLLCLLLLAYFFHCHLLASMSWFRYQTPIPVFQHLFVCFELQACPLAWYFPFTCLCKK